MADETPSLHIDTDWKKQAQEEKRKLAEQEAAKKAQSTAPASLPPVATAPVPTSGGQAGAPTRGRQAREMPVASISTLIQSLMTQSLYYLGELGGVGGEMFNLDMAKHQIDTLTALETKTKGNLEPAEQKLLDTALYETRMRFVSVASQLI
jgi:hypothetical protein